MNLGWTAAVPAALDVSITPAIRKGDDAPVTLLLSPLRFFACSAPCVGKRLWSSATRGKQRAASRQLSEPERHGGVGGQAGGWILTLRTQRPIRSQVGAGWRDPAVAGWTGRRAERQKTVGRSVRLIGLGLGGEALPPITGGVASDPIGQRFSGLGGWVISVAPGKSLPLAKSCVQAAGEQALSLRVKLRGRAHVPMALEGEHLASLLGDPRVRARGYPAPP
jgi:hypothetical protein